MNEDGINFTEYAWERFYQVVDNQEFQNRDADLIFKALEQELRFIPFGEHLKRYIYRKAKLPRPYSEVDLREYQQIIKESFAARNTPQSFTPTTAKLGALSRNWLTQQVVRRNVVFLLGFGLAMSVEEVNEFLTKVLREQEINVRLPFELICRYCYEKGYDYLKFKSLWHKYETMPPRKEAFAGGERGATAGEPVNIPADDAELMRYLSGLKAGDDKNRRTVRKYFHALYDQARDLVAGLYNQTEREKLENELAGYWELLSINDRISYGEKLRRIERRKEQMKIYRRQDITESDLERVICSAIPFDRHGNLAPGKASKLNGQFAGKRFSRQHIGDVLSGKTDVDRFDLITLNFFVFSQQADIYPNRKRRYARFGESTNRMLKECSMGPLYIANPYECFILMCILSEDPMGTYADVWELSYQP